MGSVPVRAHPDEPETATFRVQGRSGVWHMSVASDNEAQIVLTSVLPLRVPKHHRSDIGSLIERLNARPGHGTYLSPDDVGRIKSRRTVAVTDTSRREALLRAAITDEIAAIDRHLPSFFAVAGGALTPGEAEDQLERYYRYV